MKMQQYLAQFISFSDYNDCFPFINWGALLNKVTLDFCFRKIYLMSQIFLYIHYVALLKKSLMHDLQFLFGLTLVEKFKTGIKFRFLKRLRKFSKSKMTVARPS